MRYPRELRDSISDLRALPIVTKSGAQITLGAVADLRITDGPPMLRSENARLRGWVYVDLRGPDLQSAVEEMQQVVARDVKVPAGYLKHAWEARLAAGRTPTRELLIDAIREGAVHAFVRRR